MLKNILIGVNLVLVLAIGSYVLSKKTDEKRGYVINQRMFDEFKGKQELEERLKQLSGSHKKILDSLAIIVQSQPGNKVLVDHYNSTAQNFQIQYEDQSNRYTADIWKRINRYVADFGKEKGYIFIFGATGEGNLMYADEASDITAEVILYINDRYHSGE